MLTDAEFEAAERLAKERTQPIATVLYEIISRSLRRRRRE